MQTPEEMLKRTYARPRGTEPVRTPERRDLPGRKLVMNPIKMGGVYRQLMIKHDRMGTRHLG